MKTKFKTEEQFAKELRKAMMYDASIADITFLLQEWRQKDNFEAITRSVIEYLCNNHDPHTTIIITPTSAELLRGIKSTGKVMDYVKD